MIKVIVADDQQAVREGLAALLGMAGDVLVTGTAANGRQVLDLLAAGTEADVVLMDLRMPVLDGVAATTRITAEHPGIAVVVLTTYADDESIGGALRAGARGYLTKDAGRTEIATALRCAVAGQSAFDPAVTQRLVEALDAPPATRVPPDRLTTREAEVLGLIGGGLTNAEIAARLFIGETTVKTHINNAFAKIGVRNRAEAVRYAYQHELG
ncbi:response regulator transcription factor [Amycolatopsis sp. 195334CR]|uniref:response regulator transcription factor n=1 Tax=Amycolatopsis sp. 195334CR TaxID=2814588 RepID=UPI001A8F012F|nr:response regulator transcription factor [Amycolatopsis sp. 195334CR]MBN6036011.1 response regulator transcription factor [Amycolatopsis sp. 195334CR]